MKITILPTFLGLALAYPSIALAQDQAEPAPTQEEAALTALDKELADNWDPSQRGLFVYLGYYSAASIMCDELELDPAKLGKVLQEGFLTGEDQASDEDRDKLRKRLIGHLGMATGVFMGLHSHDTAEFCAKAATSKQNSQDSSSLFKD